MDVISLGAGVQSSTMLLMAGQGEILPKPQYAIFSDTGWEPKSVYTHLQWLVEESAKHGIPVIKVDNGNIRKDVLRAAKEQTRDASMPFYSLQEDGEKGIIPRKCTGEYKIQPVQRKIRELLGYEPKKRIPPNSVVQWMGISLDEVQRMKTSPDKWIELRYPLIEKRMTRADCLSWLKRNGYREPPKSSCIGCPFHSNYMWLQMKRNDPEAWNDAVKFEKELHNSPGLRGMNGKLFLHRSCKPLSEVDLQEDQIELDLFMNECDGMCGV